MGRAARAEYKAKYTAERNYQLLTEIIVGHEARAHGRLHEEWQRHPGKSRLEKAREMWPFLRTQEAFRRALRSRSFGRLHGTGDACWRMATTLELPRWNVRSSFLPSEKGFRKVYIAFREYYELNCLLEKVLSAREDFIRRGRQLWRLHRS